MRVFFFGGTLKAILSMSARQGDAGLRAVIGEGEGCRHECCLKSTNVLQFHAPIESQLMKV